jgi:hypothetical protein
MTMWVNSTTRRPVSGKGRGEDAAVEVVMKLGRSIELR